MLNAVVGSPDGQRVAGAGRDGKIYIWSTQGRCELVSILAGHRKEVQALAFSPDGQTLASGGRDGVIRLWSLADGALRQELRGKFNEVRGLAFGRLPRKAAPPVLASSHAGVVYLWDEAGRPRGVLQAHKFAVTALVFLPDGRTLATAGWDRTVKLWNIPPLFRAAKMTR